MERLTEAARASQICPRHRPSSGLAGLCLASRPRTTARRGPHCAATLLASGSVTPKSNCRDAMPYAAEQKSPPPPRAEWPRRLSVTRRRKKLPASFVGAFAGVIVSRLPRGHVSMCEMQASPGQPHSMWRSSPRGPGRGCPCAFFCSCARFSPTSAVCRCYPGGGHVFSRSATSGASHPGGEKHVRFIRLQQEFPNVPSCNAPRGM